jgi:ribosome-associated protein
VSDSIESRVRLAVAAALDKKAFDLDVLAVGNLTSIADYFVLSSATSERQAQAVADNVLEKLRDELKVRPLLVEGATPGRWILLDFGDFIFHIFTEDCRRFYGLERLWGDAPNVTADFAGNGAGKPGNALKKTS